MATNKKYFKDGNGLKIAYDGMPALKAAIKRLARDEVLVGVPEETTARPPSAADPNGTITSASLAYIHDNGAPEANIPARPFMIPGITAVRPKVEDILAKSAQYGMAGNLQKVDEGFQRVGFLVVNSIVMLIRSGIGPVLADATVAARARKGRKGAKAELARRAAGYGASAPGAGLVTPLIDTAEMVKSITYVVRPRSARRK